MDKENLQIIYDSMVSIALAHFAESEKPKKNVMRKIAGNNKRIGKVKR